MKKMMNDARRGPTNLATPSMPFDGKRMIFSGLAQVV